MPRRTVRWASMSAPRDCAFAMRWEVWNETSEHDPRNLRDAGSQPLARGVVLRGVGFRAARYRDQVARGTRVFLFLRWVRQQPRPTRDPHARCRSHRAQDLEASA